MTEHIGEIIRNQILNLVAQDAIHSGCAVVDCAIRIADPREVFLFCSTFSNTTIEVDRIMSESWRGCFFDSCTFKGKYYNSQFGIDSNQCALNAGLKDCDFTQASLNLCTFSNCTPDDLRLPGWPHVTIFHPRTNAGDFVDLARDPLLADIQESMCNTSPDVVGVIYHLPSFLRQSRSAILRLWKLRKVQARCQSSAEPPEPVFSLNEMRRLLATKPYVFM